jgi:hypothetical protein
MSGAFDALSGAQGQRVAAKSAQNIADFNAKVAEANATAERQKTNFEQIQQAKEAERIKGALAASLGAAGGTGTAVGLDLTSEQASELELENLLIGFEGETRAGQLENQAINDRLQGQLARQKSKSAARSANVGFGLQVASLGFLSGFGRGGGAAAATTPSRASIGRSINVR